MKGTHEGSKDDGRVAHIQSDCVLDFGEVSVGLKEGRKI